MMQRVRNEVFGVILLVRVAICQRMK